MELQEEQKTRKRTSLLRRILVGFLVILFSFFSLSLIIQTPLIQNWGIRQITEYMERKMETRVEVGEFDLNIFRHLVLGNVYVESPVMPGDTLLYSEKLRVNFSSILNILSGSFTINEIALTNGMLRFRRNPEMGVSSIAYLLDKLGIEASRALQDSIRIDKEAGSAKKLKFSLEDIDLNNVKLEYLDEIKSFNQHYRIGDAHIDIRDLDLERKEIHIVAIDMRDAIIRMEKTGPAVDQSPGLKNTTENTPLEYKAGIPQKEDLWKFIVDDLSLNDCQFKLDNFYRSKESPWPSDLIDYHHLDIVDIDIAADDFTMQDLAFTGKYAKVHLKHRNGFEVKELSTDLVIVNDTLMKLAGMSLELNGSQIRDTVIFQYDQYADYDDFANKVYISSHIRSSAIAFYDVVRLVPGLSKSSFFGQNRGKVLRLDGDVQGPLNRFRIRDMDLALGQIRLKGDFVSRDLAVRDNQLLSLDIEQSTFLVSELESLLPNFSLPGDFNKLETVRFSGNFDGYFQDFVANGVFSTDLGDVVMDMRLNFKTGLENALYSGRLELVNFDFGQFTGSKDLGKVTLAGQIRNGRGLTRESAYAEMEGEVIRLDFRDYLYERIYLNGQLNEKLFDGSFRIRDDHADVDFNGLIDFRDSIPNYNFKTRIKALDLGALNISKKPVSIVGDFDVALRARDFDLFFGSARGKEIAFTDSTGTMYQLDSFLVESGYQDVSKRSLKLTSDILSAEISGKFKVLEVVPLVKKHLSTNYPKYFPNIRIPDSVQNFQPLDLNFQVQLHDAKNWFGLAGIQDLQTKNMTLDGKIDGANGVITFKGMIPELHFKNINLYALDYTLKEINGAAEGSLGITAMDLNEKMVFEDIDLAMETTNEKIVTHLKTSDLAHVLNRIDVQLTTIPGEDYDRYQLSQSALEIFGVAWEIDPDNEILIGDEDIHVRDFILSGETETMVLKAFGDKGLTLVVDGFNAHYLDEVWDYDKLDFEGKYTMELSVGNVFGFRDYRLEIHSPDLQINGDSFGSFDLDAAMPKLGEEAGVRIRIANDLHNILATGYFYPPVKEVPEEKRNAWNLDVDLEKFPMRFWQYIIGDNISETRGYINGAVQFGGYINKSTLNGSGRVFDGQTTVNYLGTTYYFNDQPFSVNDRMIDLTGAILTDEAGNEAVVTGGITHSHIKDLGLDAVISSPRFIGLNTTAQDNPVYYGHAIGRMFVTFSGRLNSPTISLDGETADGTYLAIPIDYETQAAELDFVQFTDFQRDTILPVRNREINIRGLNFNMNITVTEGAIVEIIFDEQSGEILRGQGTGDIQFSLSRNGEMDMTGVYEILQGNYLFTNFIVRKPFIIQQGGTIRWDGDPFAAQINVQAEYERLRASTAILIEEYLLNASPTARSDASVRTDVDLNLILTGLLTQPNIDFEIEFPILTGEVKGYVDSKMRILRSDQNAMLEQVMGLLLTKSFLPSNTIVSSAGQVATSGIFNTVSELISAQLSSYLSGFLSEAIEDVGFISSIDFDIGFEFNPLGQNPGYTLDPNEILSESGNEVDIRLTNRLFNDRITLDLGGNYTTSSPLLEGGTYFAGDYALEYQLTQDRRLKIRFYHRNDVTIEGRKNKLGLGLSWRREFDSFSELFDSKKQQQIIQ